MGEQIGPQLLVALQVVVIVCVDVGQDVVHQRFFIVGVDLGRLHVLHAPRGDIDPQIGLFGHRDLFAGGRTQFRRQAGRYLAHRVVAVFHLEVRQRIAVVDAPQRHRAVEDQVLLALVGQANGVLRQQRVQQSGERRYLRLQQDLVIEQRVLGVGQLQLEQQIGQAGADRHLRAEQLHAVTRLGFNRQLIVRQTLSHLSHVVLQRTAADEPLVGQIFQFKGEG